MASDCASVDHEPGKPEPLSGAVWNCTCRVAEPPDVKAVATWQSSISWSVTAPPMSRAMPRSMMLVETVLPNAVGLSPVSAENWFCLSKSMMFLRGFRLGSDDPRLRVGDLVADADRNATESRVGLRIAGLDRQKVVGLRHCLRVESRADGSIAVEGEVDLAR